MTIVLVSQAMELYGCMAYIRHWYYTDVWHISGTGIIRMYGIYQALVLYGCMAYIRHWYYMDVWHISGTGIIWMYGIYQVLSII
jgi:hypothetical protein